MHGSVLSALRVSAVAGLAWTTACLEPRVESSAEDPATHFEVRIQNVGRVHPFMASGVFQGSHGETMAPLMPGQRRTLVVEAAPGCRLSMVTTVVHPATEQPVFVAFAADGLPLFDAQARPIAGDIGSELRWWQVELDDATLAHARPLDRQGEPEHAPPLPAEILDVRAQHDGEHFTITLENVSDLSEATPVVSGVWAVHDEGAALFHLDEPLRPELAALAMHGDPEPLAHALAGETGVTPTLSPGVRAVHEAPRSYFVQGDRASLEIEALAEDGDPTPLEERLIEDFDYTQVGRFGMWPDEGAHGPAPLQPSDVTWIDLEAMPGDRFSLAMADLQTNDMFIGFEHGFIDLFDELGEPIEGDLTADLLRFDAGTELDQRPGLGPTQGVRQIGPGHGIAEDDVIRPAPEDEPMHGYEYLSPAEMIRVEIRVVE